MCRKTLQLRIRTHFAEDYDTDIIRFFTVARDLLIGYSGPIQSRRNTMTRLRNRMLYAGTAAALSIGGAAGAVADVLPV